MSNVGPQAGSLQVDSSDLRAFFDALRVALSSGRVALAPSIIADDGLLHALQRVLAAFDTRSRPAQTPLSGLPAPHRSDNIIGPLRHTLETIRDAWLRRVRDTITREKAEVLKNLLGSTTPDFLGLLDLTDDENRHSAVLRWLLDPKCAPTIAPLALIAFTKRLDRSSDWAHEIRAALELGSIVVRREYTISREWTDEDRLDRIDLVVLSRKFFLAIENKVWAPEHDEQTRRYWEWMQSLKVLRAGILLSPSGFLPASEGFKSMSYLELLPCILEGLLVSTPTAAEKIVLESYVKTLAAGILRSELHAIQDWGEQQ